MRKSYSPAPWQRQRPAPGLPSLPGLAQFEEVGGMDAAMVAEAFAAGDDSCSAQTQVAGGKHQTLGQRLVTMAVVLLGEEGDLVAFRGRSPQECLNSCQEARPASVIKSEPVTWVTMAPVAQARKGGRC